VAAKEFIPSNKYFIGPQVRRVEAVALAETRLHCAAVMAKDERSKPEAQTLGTINLEELRSDK
jgi:hypothetical protein